MIHVKSTMYLRKTCSFAWWKGFKLRPFAMTPWRNYFFPTTYWSKCRVVTKLVYFRTIYDSKENFYMVSPQKKTVFTYNVIIGSVCVLVVWISTIAKWTKWNFGYDKNRIHTCMWFGSQLSQSEILVIIRTVCTWFTASVHCGNFFSKTTNYFQLL